MAEQRELRVVMLGAPGSGKGTQAEILSARVGVPAISTGALLRDAVKTGSELGLQVRSIMEAGALVDDTTMRAVVRERLRAADSSTGFILDGYPRTREQAEDLDQILGGLGVALNAVVMLEVPEDELIRRALLRQRADDTEEVIRRRQQVYREVTEPLIGLYRHAGLLCSLEADQPIDAVADDIVTALGVAA
jgi:adenylate kinase